MVFKAPYVVVGHNDVGTMSDRCQYNIRDRDTINQMASVVAGLIGKRLMYRELIRSA